MIQQLCTVEPLYTKEIVKKKRKTLCVMLLSTAFRAINRTKREH